MVQIRSYTLIILIFLIASCSSAPKTSNENITKEDGEAFLNKYCASNQKALFEKELTGDVLIRSSAKEFKGQFPASVHFARDKSFTVEVTNLIGGTVVLLKGNNTVAEIISPSRPQYNRKGITHYMGLPIPVLMQLLHGDLPCAESTKFRFEGNAVVVEDLSVKSAPLEWWYERSDAESHGVPVRLRIMDHGQPKVEMTIESWNPKGFYAEKVKVHTSEGDLKWSWRSRELK